MKKKSLILSIILVLVSLASPGCHSDNLTSQTPTKDGWGIFTNTEGIHDWVADGNYIWMATDGGALQLDTRTKEFKKYTIIDGLLSNYLLDIVKDSSGNLFFSCPYGINQYNSSGWSAINISDGSRYSYISDLFIDSKDTLWAKTGPGVSYQSGASWMQLKNDRGNSVGSINQMFEDSQGKYWFVDDNSISVYDGIKWKYFDFEDYSRLIFDGDIVEDAAGRIWIGTRSNGVLCIDDTDYRFYTISEGLTGDSIATLYTDTKGTIWTGTNEGINHFDGEVWTSYSQEDGIPGYKVNGIVEADDGTLWCASGYGYGNGGISYLENNVWHPVIEGDNLSGTAILKDNDGTLWFNLFRLNRDMGVTREIYRYTNKSLEQITLPNELPDNETRTVFQDTDGDLWVGTFTKGVGRFDGRTWTTINMEDGLSNLWVTTIAQDADGAIWCNAFNPYSEIMSDNGPPFFGNGANRYKDGIWTNYLEGSGYNGEYIWDIYLDAENRLWFCTQHGLKSFEDGGIVSTNITEALPDSYFESITQDNEGNLWVIFEGEIAKYDGNTWELNPHPEMFSGRSVTAIFQDTSGNYWFGTNNALYRYDGTNFESYTENDGFSSSRVVAIDEDSQGVIRAATEECLYSFDGATWTSISIPGVLPEWDTHIIWDMIIDDDNIVWIASSRGLLFYDPN